MAEAGFVAVEGIDASGKTTLVAALATALVGSGSRVATRIEPSLGPIGVFFRRFSGEEAELPALAAALLSAADRHQQQPALARELAEHDVVLSDRYYLSGLAYHHADGVDPAVYRELNQGIRRPDLYLYLDVPPTVAATRRSPTHRRWERPAFTARLPVAYATCITLLAEVERAHVIHIDATQAADRVLRTALTVVQKLRQERSTRP